MSTELLEPITTFITNLGFPIAWSFILFWYINKQNDTHREEVKDLTKVIESNTEAVIQMKQLLEDMLDGK